MKKRTFFVIFSFFIKIYLQSLRAARYYTFNYVYNPNKGETSLQ